MSNMDSTSAQGQNVRDLGGNLFDVLHSERQSKRTNKY